MYRMGAANGQYRQMGAEGCVVINETEADLTTADVDRMIEEAEDQLAMIGDEIVVQFGDDSSKQETYTERSLRASLRKLMKS